METLFRSILCPIDFDRVSIPAVEMVRKIGQQTKSRAILLYIIPGEGQKPSEDELRVAQDSMRAISRKWFEGVLPHEIIIRSGDPAQEIVKAANDLDAELIVMATHGRTGIEHFLLGSVAERVVREAERPVLTVRPLHHA
ncbi:MAG TPA: universal stress protein [Candidatus Binataceae bacterium]|nr:universal stress protein [Candidatus Binataceae bacterium]